MEKTVADLLTGVHVEAVLGIEQTVVKELVLDSRKAKPGCLFFALPGATQNGEQFISKAIESGAVVVVSQSLPHTIVTGVTYVLVSNAAEAMGKMAANFYEQPSAQLKLVGVTGTNGKTTTATLLFKLFRELGYSCGLLSTVQNQINDEVIPSQLTTPDALTIQQMLAQMVKTGCMYCFMEVSSHATVQQRIAGLQFAGGVFTNLSHDHLDYHGTFDAYIAAKKSFFDSLPAQAFALVNTDDKRGEVMLQNTQAKKHTYALQRMADFKGRVIESTLNGLHMEVDGQEAWFKLVGNFNAANLLAVYAAAVLLGEDKSEVLTALSGLDAVAGRFECTLSTSGICAVVDYAHTPDALENVLQTIQEIRTGKQRIITVVGCGGNRDAAKRPLMANIAKKYSDEVILTSDNPRAEDPEQILKQMIDGLSPADQVKVLKITDRKEAIKTACHLAAPADIVLIAGKGHENYQEINGQRQPFDDKVIVKEVFELLGK